MCLCVFEEHDNELRKSFAKVPDALGVGAFAPYLLLSWDHVA